MSREAMAYDEDLAYRVRETMQGERGVTEKRRFGGVAFLIDGNLAVSASGRGGLLVRVDPAQSASPVDEPHTRRFTMRDRQMEGWRHVDAHPPEAAEFKRWVCRGAPRVLTVRWAACRSTDPVVGAADGAGRSRSP